MRGKVRRLRVVGDKFGHDGAIGDEINERNVLTFQEIRTQQTHEFTAEEIVAHYLGDVEQRGFQSGRAASDDGRMAVGEKCIGLIPNGANGEFRMGSEWFERCGVRCRRGVVQGRYCIGR